MIRKAKNLSPDEKARSNGCPSGPLLRTKRSVFAQSRYQSRIGSGNPGRARNSKGSTSYPWKRLKRKLPLREKPMSTGPRINDPSRHSHHRSNFRFASCWRSSSKVVLVAQMEPLRASALQELYSEYEELTRSAYTPRAVCCLLSMHKKWKSTSAPGQRIRRQPIEKFLSHIRKDKCWNASNFSKGRYAIQSWI